MEREREICRWLGRYRGGLCCSRYLNWGRLGGREVGFSFVLTFDGEETLSVLYCRVYESVGGVVDVVETEYGMQCTCRGLGH